MDGGLGAESASSRQSPGRGGFRFARRTRGLNWRVLHGIDLARVVANRDVAALERGLAAVLQGDVAFDDPLHLSPHNYAQLIRLCQLGIDYLEHEVAWRRNIVLSLQEKYAGMRRYIEALEGLSSALEEETAGLLQEERLEAYHSAARQRRLAAARAAHSEKGALNEAIEQCEEAASCHRAFSFNAAHLAINWQALHSVDIGEVLRSGAIAELVAVEEMVTFGDLGRENQQELSEANFKQMARLAQCIVEVLCFWRLKFLQEQESWEAHCGVLAPEMAAKFDLCKLRERELRAAARGRPGSPGGGAQPGGSPGASTPGGGGGASGGGAWEPHQYRPDARWQQPQQSSPASAGGAPPPPPPPPPTTPQASPASDEVRHSLQAMRLKMREEAAHQAHLREKLEGLQRAMDRMKLRSLQRLLDEQRIRDEEQYMAMTQLRATVDNVRQRAVAEHAAFDQTNRRLFTVHTTGPMSSHGNSPDRRRPLSPE
eukprot:jgi/Tetstr1/465742/TSEL_010367.t1